MPFSFVLPLFLSILLVAGNILNQKTQTPKAVQDLVVSFHTPFSLIRTKKDILVGFLKSTPRLYRENQQLKNENNLLRVKIKNLDELIADKKMVDSLTKSWEIQPVRLVSVDRQLTFISHNFANIKPGQPVASGNSLVGLVKSVNPPVIRATALSQMNERLGVTLTTGAKGAFIYRDNEPRVIDLPTDVSYDPQTIVVTSGSELVPDGMLVGRIEKITTTKASPTQEAIVEIENPATQSNFYIITGIN